MAALEVLALVEGTPQIRAPGSGDTYTLPRAATITSKLTITGATETTSNPVLDATQTWNAGGVTFTGIKFNVTNTASSASSRLASLQVGGNAVFEVGNSSTAPMIYIGPSSGGDRADFRAQGFSFFLRVAGSASAVFNDGGDFSVARALCIGSAVGLGDAQLSRAAAGFFKATNGSTGFAAVGTYAVAVASLPAASATYTGARAFVTDANATTFASIVAGGGANGVPVYCDGSQWRIG